MQNGDHCPKGGSALNPILASMADTAGDGPSFGLALGCGGARSLAQLHAIEAFDEMGVRPAAISGTSMGGILGVSMAAGFKGADLRAHALRTLGGQARILARLWRSRPKGMKQTLRGFRVGQLDIEGVLDAFLPAGFPEDFGDLQVPAQVVATDYYGDQEIVIGEGSVRKALAATACMPPVFLPVVRDGRLLIDGGLRNPVPFDLLEGKADVIVAVDATGTPARQKGGPKPMETMYGASQHMQRAIMQAKMRPGLPTALLTPAIGGYRSLDFGRTAEILEATKGLKDEVKRVVDAAFENWRRPAA